MDAHVSMGRRLRPSVAIAAALMFIFIGGGVVLELTPITPRQELVLQVMVAATASITNQTVPQVWHEVSRRTGASDPTLLKEWYYPDALDEIGRQIELSRLLPASRPAPLKEPPTPQ